MRKGQSALLCLTGPRPPSVNLVHQQCVIRCINAGCVCVRACVQDLGLPRESFCQAFLWDLVGWQHSSR